MPTVGHLQAYVDELASAEWFRARWNERKFEVRPGHGHRRATASQSGVLQFPIWSRSELVVLHEVAHCLVPVTSAAHGPEYAGVLISLVRRHMGPGPGQALEETFLRHRVRWSASVLRQPVRTEPPRCGPRSPRPE
ncbi:MAG: hypothetical protein ABR540_06490 [Acidimicrobiales bacterium]